MTHQNAPESPEIETTSRVTSSSRIQVAPEHIFCELEGEAVILSLKDGIYYGLNAVGLAVWSRIQQPVTYSDLIDQLIEDYEVDRTQCEQDVARLLTQLNDKGLIVIEKA